MIRLGCCTDVPVNEASQSRAKKMIQTGFDYLELGLSKIVSMNEDDKKRALFFLESNEIKVEAMNLFIPNDIRVVGNDVDMDVIRRYFEKAFPIAKEFGAKTLVFGSGGARCVPHGFSYEFAMTQLIALLRFTNGYCEDFDMTIAIEPLGNRECNIVTSVSQGFWLAKYVDRPRIRLLADFYHMQCNSEDSETVLNTKGMLVHTHIASKKGRYYPLASNRSEFEAFFNCLKEMGYDGGMSIEGSTDSFDTDIFDAFSVLDSLRKDPLDAEAQYTL